MSNCHAADFIFSGWFGTSDQRGYKGTPSCLCKLFLFGSIDLNQDVCFSVYVLYLTL